ncbi:hypothetical protein ACF9IK_36005 [Kitasatospora hibisci]|uniref:hypothetical protein n=1 Tax=Kitasatospora hibisci TaxID=3369522 RepID=UPI0037541EE0
MSESPPTSPAPRLSAGAARPTPRPDVFREPLTEETVAAADVVMATMGCGDVSLLPSVSRVEALLAELTPGEPK